MEDGDSNEALQKTVSYMFIIGVVLGTISGFLGLQILGIIGVFMMIIAVIILIIAIVTNN